MRAVIESDGGVGAFHVALAESNFCRGARNRRRSSRRARGRRSGLGRVGGRRAGICRRRWRRGRLFSPCAGNPNDCVQKREGAKYVHGEESEDHAFSQAASGIARAYGRWPFFLTGPVRTPHGASDLHLTKNRVTENTLH